MRWHAPRRRAPARDTGRTGRRRLRLALRLARSGGVVWSGGGAAKVFAVPRYLDFTPRERSIDARERLIDRRVPAVAAANGWKSSSFARLWSFFERSLRHESALGRWKFALLRGSHLQRASTVAPRPSRSRETRKGSPRRGTRRLFTTQDFDRVPTRSLKPDRATARSLFTIVRSREAAIVDQGSMFC